MTRNQQIWTLEFLLRELPEIARKAKLREGELAQHETTLKTLIGELRAQKDRQTELQ